MKHDSQRRLSSPSRIARRLLVCAVAALGGVVAGTQSGSGPTATDVGSSGGQFRVSCRYAHTLADDPIAHFGHPGASHVHDFYGNLSTHASSLVDTMEGAGTTCALAGDTAGYWTPQLLVDGRAVAPEGLSAYYRNSTSQALSPFPEGLRMLVGNPRASHPQSTSVVAWGCEHPSGIDGLSSPTRCHQQVRVHFYFPDCWDGRNLDSADHTSHMAYSTHGRCPSSHPVAVPQLTLANSWALHDVSPSRITLSSGSAASVHADFWNTWDQSVLRDLVGRCLQAHRNCAEVTGGHFHTSRLDLPIPGVDRGQRMHAPGNASSAPVRRGDPSSPRRPR